MKKIVSLVLVLCMMVFAFSALAEQTTEAAPQGTESAQSGESSADSSEAMSKLFAESGESAEGTEGQGVDTEAVMQALGATKMEDVKAVPADSADKFYGAFTVTKMVMNGYAFDLSVMMGAAAATPSLTISAEGVSTADESGEAKLIPFESCELVDGVLNVVLEGNATKLSLLEDGSVLMSVALPGEEAVEMGLILAAAK